MKTIWLLVWHFLSYAGLFVKFCCSYNPSHLFWFVPKCLTRGRRFKLSNQKEMNLENGYKREEKKEKISLEEAIQLQLLKQIAIKNFQVNEVLEQWFWYVNISFLSRWSMWDKSVKFQQRSQQRYWKLCSQDINRCHTFLTFRFQNHLPQCFHSNWIYSFTHNCQ